MNKKTRYYESFTDDFETAADNNKPLPDGYRWINDNLFARILSATVYCAALAFSLFWCRGVLHIRIKGKEKLKTVKGGYFIYGNHTQPVGDVFTPALCAFPKRIYTIVSKANYALPVIGKILPYLGALPVDGTLHAMRELNGAVEKRIRTGHPVIIYPEAHVWEYYTGIRPFADTSFKYPAKLGAPVFAMTCTYKKSRFFKRPACTVYIDGPFFAGDNSLKQNAAYLKEKVFEAMNVRAAESDFEYIEYKPKKEDK